MARHGARGVGPADRRLLGLVPSLETAEPEAAATDLTGHGTVLLVEDEEAVRHEHPMTQGALNALDGAALQIAA